MSAADHMLREVGDPHALPRLLDALEVRVRAGCVMPGAGCREGRDVRGRGGFLELGPWHFRDRVLGQRHLCLCSLGNTM